MEQKDLKTNVVDFWTGHPLGSYEIKTELGSEQFFAQLVEIRNSASTFVMDFYFFNKSKGKTVLDVGCGPGWVSHQYGEAGANIYSMDLTTTAVGLASRYFQKDNLKGNFVVADAEHIPFENKMFDYVTCDGVLHHTPGTLQGIKEIHRVLKDDGEAGISLYYKNILLYEPVFFVTKLVMRLLKVRMHGVKVIPMSMTQEEFGNWYDGVDNPLGKIYSYGQCKDMFKEAGFKIQKHRVYYFPKRFSPFLEKMPRFIHRIFDGCFGTMIYFTLKKI
jgi:ubiquinone/menaquinone biosynthesis C-methylase UbiE